MRRTTVVTLTFTLLGFTTGMRTSPAGQPHPYATDSVDVLPWTFDHAARTVGDAAETADPNGVTSDGPTRAIPPIDDDISEDLDRADLSGNDVSDAVATYKMDASGSLYEEHAPDTEVPQLAAPTT